jgi:hypothetical protein
MHSLFWLLVRTPFPQPQPHEGLVIWTTKELCKGNCDCVVITEFFCFSEESAQQTFLASAKENRVSVWRGCGFMVGHFSLIYKKAFRFVQDHRVGPRGNVVSLS